MSKTNRAGLRRLATFIKSRRHEEDIIVSTLHSKQWDSTLFLFTFLNTLGIESVLVTHDIYSYSDFIKRIGGALE